MLVNEVLYMRGDILARPQKDGLDYFPHDTDAASDEKIEPLVILYGAKGYAFYFYHLERIYRQKDFELDVSDAETIQLISSKLQITTQEYDSILQSALKRGAFDKTAYNERGVLTSDGIKKRAAPVLKKRENMRATVTEAETTQKHASKHTETPKVKESIVKKSRAKESKYLPSHMLLAEMLRDEILTNNGNAKIPPSLEDWADCFRLMTDIDKREEIHIRKVIKWCQQDSFWKANILSAKKLREKFDTLFMQMNRTSTKPYSGNSSVDAINDFYRRLNNEPNSQTTGYSRDIETIDISVSEREDYP